MDKLFPQLVESCKTNRAALRHLKEAAVKTQNYELAIQLRDLEVKTFLTPDKIEAEKFATTVKIILNGAGIETTLENCWLIGKLLNLDKISLGKISLEDTRKLQEECRQLLSDRGEL